VAATAGRRRPPTGAHRYPGGNSCGIGLARQLPFGARTMQADGCPTDWRRDRPPRPPGTWHNNPAAPLGPPHPRSRTAQPRPSSVSESERRRTHSHLRGAQPGAPRRVRLAVLNASVGQEKSAGHGRTDRTRTRLLLLSVRLWGDTHTGRPHLWRRRRAPTSASWPAPQSRPSRVTGRLGRPRTRGSTLRLLLRGPKEHPYVRADHHAVPPWSAPLTSPLRPLLSMPLGRSACHWPLDHSSARPIPQTKTAVLD
jgi:hypothetical protein